MDIEIGSFQYIDDKTMELDEHPFLPQMSTNWEQSAVSLKNLSQEDKKE